MITCNVKLETGIKYSSGFAEEHVIPVLALLFFPWTCRTVYLVPALQLNPLLQYDHFTLYVFKSQKQTYESQADNFSELNVLKFNRY